jgi:O-antigen/teichoic acid export membrane protein
MLGALLTAVPRYFVGGSLGDQQLGIFSGLMVMASVGNMAAAAAGQAAFVPLAALYAKGAGRRFARLVGILCATGILLGGCGVAVAALGGARLLTILFRPEFAGFEREFVLAAAVAGLGYLTAPFGFGMTAARLYAPQVPLLLAAVLAVTAGSALFVPRLGIRGAMLALIAGSLVQSAGGLGILVWAFRGRTGPSGVGR